MINERIEKCLKEFEVRKKTFIDRKGGNSKYCIENPNGKKFQEIDFETCVYENNKIDTKCDYGLQVDDTVYFIELKGSDVKKGIEQILSTINDTKDYFNNKKFNARLLVSIFPKPELVKQTKEYKDLNKIVKKSLIIKQHIHTEKI